MAQIIQLLHTGEDTDSGLLLRAVSNAIAGKTTLSPLEKDLKELIFLDDLSMAERLALQKRLTKINLLSPGEVNPKTAKDAGLDNIDNYILHLSPSNLSGVNICPMASKGCRAACLNGAGRGLFDGVQLPRLRKTLYFLKFKQQFLRHLDNELTRIEKRATKKGSKIIVRLNGTSDLSWELMPIDRMQNIFQLHPNIQFYDYTKVFRRLEKIINIPNYHITFSASESNWTECIKALALGVNVATVFRDKLPAEYMSYKVIDGDKHDFRFLDPKESIGLIVGLKAKGPAKRDSSGFVKVA